MRNYEPMLRRTGMLAKIVLIICCLLACAEGNMRDYPVSPSPIERLRTEGIRAMSNSDHKKMSEAGFNLSLGWKRILTGSTKSTTSDSPVILREEDFSERAVKQLREWALKCKKNDLIMMYMMYVAAEPSVRHLTGLEGNLLNYLRTGEGIKKVWPAHNYRHIVDWNGHQAKWAPCPLESRYWMGFIKPQLEMVAKVLKETNVAGGGALELETYCFYSIYPGMASQKKTFCYCDSCYYGFVQSLDKTNQAPDAVLPEKRFDWLTQRGLLYKYEKYLEDSLTKIIKQMIDDVRKINSEFIFGFYPYAPFWYYDALIRGGGTPQLPCIVFPNAEYSGGFAEYPSRTFFGDVPTPDCVAHLKRRRLAAMYAGGLWARNIGSPKAVATAMDRLLRGADGFWIYNDFGHVQKSVPEELWQEAGRINQWTDNNPGHLRQGDIRTDLLAAAVKQIKENKPEGIMIENSHIVTRCVDKDVQTNLLSSGFEDRTTVEKIFFGRGTLPELDKTVFHSGKASMRFDSCGKADKPQSPYIYCKIPSAQIQKTYELSFQTKAVGSEPVLLWIGKANSKQHPGYMYYRNFVVQPDGKWQRLRVGIRYKKDPPLVLRFWVPPTAGKLWLDDITLKPVQARTIEIPVNMPASALKWAAVDWELSPSDARYDATIVDVETNQLLRTRLYNGDNLAPLAAVTETKALILRLTVYPSVDEPVILEKVKAGFCH